VDEETGEQLLAVVQEALSNVARHAKAHEAAETPSSPGEFPSATPDRRCSAERLFQAGPSPLMPLLRAGVS
jgi:hypothetical protein